MLYRTGILFKIKRNAEKPFLPKNRKENITINYNYRSGMEKIMIVKTKILVIHGPNLNMLGEREKGIYGNDTLESINEQIKKKAESLGATCDTFQSNYEGAIIDKIQEARLKYSGIVINPGAYTHYSYAIRDARSEEHTSELQSH